MVGAANPARGEVGFEADGKAYTLKLATNELAACEKRFGIKINGFEAFFRDPSISDIITMFAIGLQRHHPGTTDAAAGDIIDALGFTEAARLIVESVQLSFPAPTPGEAVAETVSH
jgi:hypothetical protein